jgi:hypothetical protein
MDNRSQMKYVRQSSNAEPRHAVAQARIYPTNSGYKPLINQTISLLIALLLGGIKY